VPAAGSVLNTIDRVAEVGEGRVERDQHTPERMPADIELSALHPRDVGVVSAGARPHFALRHACPLAERAQRSAEDELVLGGLVGHISWNL
jgi:hypothetical protein